jgi:hypothetical protein
MIIPTEVAGTFSLKKGATLGEFANYMLCDGQRQAEELGYSPLPLNLVQAGFKQIARIPGAGKAANTDISKCNNPTFKPGDKPGNNLLAKTAPMPLPCDKQGSTQCAPGQTAGTTKPGTSEEENPDGGSEVDPSNPETGVTGGSGGNIYVGPTANGKANLEAYAYEIPKQPWGLNQTLMLIAAILLLLVIVAPAIVVSKLNARKSKAESE